MGNTTDTEAVAVCRGCGRNLKGKPYYMGGEAYHPKTNERCKVNFYGGFVCSEQCDIDAAVELERTMPGHDPTKKAPSYMVMQEIKRKWAK